MLWHDRAHRRGSYLSYSKILASETIFIHFQSKNEMIILVKMVYLEGICMAKADSHVVREQCNKESPKGPACCALEVTTIVLPA